MQGEQTDKDGRMSNHQQQHQSRGNNDVEKALSSPGGVRTSSGESSGGGDGDKERKNLSSSQQGTGKLSVELSEIIRPGGFINNYKQKANGRNEDDKSEAKKRHSERIRIVTFISKALSCYNYLYTFVA